jgi:hypothetical protein
VTGFRADVAADIDVTGFRPALDVAGFNYRPRVDRVLTEPPLDILG